MKNINEILERGVIVEILPSEEDFKKLLLSGKKLRFYIGFDATAPVLHLSHAKNFMLMEEFRKLGHEVIILFGDFTARIGDPSGENSARKQLSKEEVDYNVKEWKKLVEPLMDFKDKENPTKIMYNSEWLSCLNFEEIIDLASNFTVQQMMERDMFQKRIDEKKPIYLHEFFYPLMQGYDSVAMDVDVEVCGTDQTFNALAGRTLLKKIKNKEKYVVALNLTENPKTGQLMSKSKGTGVFLGVDASEMYGQIMAQPDEMIKILFINNTRIPLKEIGKIMDEKNPKKAKERLAFEIVKIFHGEEKSIEAQEEFKKVFEENEIPSDIPVFQTSEEKYPILDLIFDSKLASSKKEAKRLVEGGAVKIDSEKIEDWKKEINIKNNMIIQVGKRKFIKIKK